MTEQQHLWACAHEVVRQHGTEAPGFVAERIGALALKGDVDGVETWRAIAERMAALQPSAVPSVQ